MIPFINLDAQQKKYHLELENAGRKVLESGCFIGGPQVEALEKELSLYTGVPQVVTCGSGTDALTLALMALDLKPGDKVIVPDFTFVAPAECVAFLGAIPIFADIDRHTMQIAPQSVASLVDEKVKGIIAVDLFGQCAPFKELRKIANDNGLWIIEDGAQAFGTTVYESGSPHSTETIPSHKRRACSFGDISTTSFYPAKPLGCYGDGGALFTEDQELAQKIRALANHGSQERYKHKIIGMNSRLDALQAAILQVKLSHFDEELALRQKKAKLYDSFFTGKAKGLGLPQVTPQKLAPGNTSTYAQYTVLAEDRNSFIRILEIAKIPYCIHYPSPLHEQPCFAPWASAQKLPVNLESKWAAEHVVSLPFCAFTQVQEILERLESAEF